MMVFKLDCSGINGLSVNGAMSSSLKKLTSGATERALPSDKVPISDTFRSIVSINRGLDIANCVGGS